MAGATKWGSELLVNTTTTSSQFDPSITRLVNGRFVITWVDNSLTGGDPDGDAIKAQLYNADGSKLGSEFLVNTSTASHQRAPAVVALPDGGFAVAWSDSSTFATTGVDIRAQVFNFDGTKRGGEFLVNSVQGNAEDFPAVAALADQFVVTWDDASGAIGDASGNGVGARIFNANGAAAGSEFLVNTTTTNSQEDSAVAGLTNGTFVAAWTDFSGVGGDSSSTGVHAQIFNANGSKSGAEFLVNTSTSSTQDHPAVAVLSDGRFVISWEDDSTLPTTGTEIRAQIFNADGSKSGSEFVVNSAHSGAQDQPTVIGLDNGRFAIAWRDHSQTGEDTSGYAIRAQVFDANGAMSGTEFVVNTTTAGDQANPTITTLMDGRMVVSWWDQNTVDVRAQIFDPRDRGVNVTGTALADDFIGSQFDDTIAAGPGADRIDGAIGNDTASYAGSATGVNASLLTGTGTSGDAIGDTLVSIENLRGSSHNDTLTGNAQDNILDGGAGDDTAVFSSLLATCTIQDFGAKILVSGPDGNDTVMGIEHLQFADVSLAVFDDGSPLFDRLFYLSRNADVFSAGIDPLGHFNAFGFREGRDPDAFFDTSAYLAVNADVATLGVNPMDHYHNFGWKEGRDPGPDFDTRLYLLRNPDIAAAGVDPLEHYLQYGRSEGRQAYQAIGSLNDGFDVQYYLFHNPDVAALGVDPLAHFNDYGWHEGRNPNAWFDTAGYLSHYGDVAAVGVNPLLHYMTHGWKEGRDPSAGFDTLGYLAQNGDVAAAGLNPLEHFMQYGIYEGRQAVNDGVWH